MNAQKSLIRWKVVVVVVLAFAGIYAAAGLNLKTETDIVASLPRHDRVMSDARYIVTHYPVFDRVFIDIGLKGAGTDTGLLMTTAAYVEKGMRTSGLFREVGFRSMTEAMPELLSRVVSNLPYLFSRQDLQSSVQPLLGDPSVRSILKSNMDTLQGLGGLGQSGLIARDPLGLRNIVLARMGALLPVHDAVFENGFLMSRDRRHILIIAEPEQSATDNAFALKIQNLLNGLIAGADRDIAGARQLVAVTPVGSYRAAIDNETVAKRDTMRAVILSTLGIALLLLITFPRWYIGLMALIPALAGTAAALLVMSLVSRSLSVLAIGFGGAIISINVDYGIAYLLFLDRTQATSGANASKQSFWVGLGASFTTIGSFLALNFSGFPILVEIGWFTAMGTLFSFAFVHTVFPLVFRRMSPARRKGFLLMEKITARLSLSSGWTAFVVVGLFGVCMAFLAHPQTKVDVEAMNTVSTATRSAEASVRKTWGDVLSNTTYILMQGDSVAALQEKSDRLDGFIDRSTASGMVRSAFSLSSVFPGKSLARENLSAWKEFWTRQRIGSLSREMTEAGTKEGFSRTAFEPFFSSLGTPAPPDTIVPPALYDLFGITRGRSNGRWMIMSAVHPGPDYRPAAFYEDLSGTGIGRMFDAAWFARRLSHILFTMFVKMGVLCGIGLVIVLVFYFMDLLLVVLTLVPVAFALVCTFATYHLLHRPLDIPSLLLVVIVFGMGVDYPIYFIGAHQRYFDERDPAMRPLRMAVFLNAGSTIIGLGVLAFAGQSMLRSAGFSMVLGLVYALVGTVALLPPVLRTLYVQKHKSSMPPAVIGSSRHRASVQSRYRFMETYTRMFARFKVLLDPMFPRLADFVRNGNRVLDLGCGYGVPSAWLLCLYPDAYFFGIDPDPDRVRVARRVFGDRGTAVQGSAQDFPASGSTYDVALMLDIIHYLSDDELARSLSAVSSHLAAGGTVVIRATVPSQGRVPWERWLEQKRLKAHGQLSYFRSAERVAEIIAKAGLVVTSAGEHAPGREETWFVCRKES